MLHRGPEGSTEPHHIADEVGTFVWGISVPVPVPVCKGVALSKKKELWVRAGRGNREVGIKGKKQKSTCWKIRQAASGAKMTLRAGAKK